MSLGTREPSFPLYLTLFLFISYHLGVPVTGILRLHVIGPAARLAPSGGGVAPLLVPLCYDFTGPTWTRRLLVLSLMRTSASRSGTTRAPFADVQGPTVTPPV